MAKKILMIVAPKEYRDEELNIPRDIFKQKGYEVVIASKGVKEASGMLGGKTQVDLDLSEVNTGNFDAVIFIGGAGATIFQDDPEAHKIAKQAESQSKVLGAICIAPLILANAGILKDKNATISVSEGNKLQLS